MKRIRFTEEQIIGVLMEPEERSEAAHFFNRAHATMRLGSNPSWRQAGGHVKCALSLKTTKVAKPPKSDLGAMGKNTLAGWEHPLRNRLRLVLAFRRATLR